MNKIYSLVRHPITGALIAVSELARKNSVGTVKAGRQHSLIWYSRIPALLITLLIAMPVITNAQTVDLGPFNPIDNDNQVGVTVVSGSETITIQGQLSNIETGATNSPSQLVTFDDLLKQGRVTSGAEFIGAERVEIGQKTKTIEIFNPATQGNVSLAVYDSEAFAKLGDISPEIQVLDYLGVGDQQYIDLRLGSVDASGGTLNIELGDVSKSANDQANSKTIAAKRSSLFHADGTGSDQSRINWASKAHFKGSALAADSDGNIGVAYYGAVKYGGSFTAFDGSEHTVNDIEEAKAYNDWLIAQLQSGALDPGQYNNEFDRALVTQTAQIQIKTIIPEGDDFLEARGNNYVIETTGANAVGTVAEGADLIGSYQIASVMRATQGAQIINDGTVTHAGVGLGIVMLQEDSGSRGQNNGVLNAGFIQNEDGSVSEVSAARVMGAQALNGAEFDNNGVMNVATATSQHGGTAVGIYASGGSVATNNGSINVGVNGMGGGSGAVGADVWDSDFTNNGVIYLGRDAQRNISDDVKDTALATGLTSERLVGIRTFYGSKAVIDNAGEITIGALTHGATGIYSNNSSSVSNSGVINVNGALADVSRENVGMYAHRANNMTNTGVIRLNGTNSVGLKSSTLDFKEGKAGGTASIVNTGTVTVAGGVDSRGFRNFGALAEGNGAKVEIAGGQVELTGDGAIGVHADAGGNITVSGGKVEFVEGQDQIGFFAHGVGSSVDIESAPVGGLVVDTERSTLFRIEDGATINNSAGAKLIASGKDSTAVQVTGVGSTANLDGMDITVSGDGATAVKVEGGATGQMTGAAKLELKDGATAVVIDNRKYDLNGHAVASAQSTFSNSADVQVLDAKDVTAFSVRNGATLINSGDIHLSHGTAIEVAGTGSSVVADATGKRGKVTVEDGVAGIHVHAGATLNTMDDITVDGLASGVLVGADAGRVVIEKDAKITGKSSSLGNLITNQAVAGNTLVDGATLEMAGKGAALLTENSLHQDSHGHVISSGEGTGVAVMKSDRSMLERVVAFGKEWLVDVTGFGSGFSTNNAGTTVIGSQVNVSGAGTAVVSAHEKGTLVLTEDARLTTSNTEATLVSGQADTVVNRGVLQAASSDATAVSLEGAGTFANLGEGLISGAVKMGDGDSSVLLADVSQHEGVLSTGEGNNLVEVQGNDVRFGQLLGGTSGLDTLMFNGHDYRATTGNANQIQEFERVALINGTTLTLERDFQLNGAVGMRQASLNGSEAGWLTIDGSSTLAALQDGHSVLGSVANAGRVNLSNGVAGSTLTVLGDFAGANGVVELDTVLGDDSSLTDKLVVKGSTSGNSFLKVNNAGGTGAYTTADGIEVIQVGGASEGAFALAGRVVAGTKEYLLAKGGKSDPLNGNWYLRSEMPVVDPEPPVEPEEPVLPELPPVDPEPPVEPEEPVLPELPPVDPEPPVKPEEPVLPELPPVDPE
ncbi:autotransporter outer membrane beta-barrel domain-containing protein, partial [Aeromonas salmonicida]|uniref:autotransporter outer membrane beta-barrel domain-containing protein n=1 Tax=Aeromonas salmonicida TaxID=645 RepID=UPI00259EA212